MTSEVKNIIEDHEFVVDLARYAEGSLSEQQVKKKYHFDDATWALLGENDALVERIEAEKIRRVRDGSTARECAQQIFATAPGVLGGFYTTTAPRHDIGSRAQKSCARSPASDRNQRLQQIGSRLS